MGHTEYWNKAEVEGLNFRVFRALSLTSMLADLLLGALAFVPGTFLSMWDFRILFSAFTLIFAAGFLLSLREKPFPHRHSTFLLYASIFTCQVFFFLLDRVIAHHRGSEAPYTLILGFLMVQPIIITDRTLRLALWSVLSVLECSVLSLMTKSGPAAANDIINCTVLSVVGIVIGRVSKTYFLNYTEMKVKEKDVEIMAAEAAGKAKTEFLALISHEVRTPLNAVMNLNEMILRESPDQTVLGYSRGIKQACRTLSSLINDILDFSKLNSGEFTLLPIEYKLDGMLDDVLNMIIPRARGKGLEFNVDVQEDTPNNLMGDDIRIKQCLVNLLSNAVKYTDSGSVTLSVSWQRAEEDDDQSMCLTVKVSDTGIGIKEGDIEKISHPFERLDELKNRSIEGTGLGLAIVRGILNKMGSNLQVRSEYGRGSEFSFTIWQPVSVNVPVGSYGAASLSGGEARAARYGTFTAPEARILVVDDMQVNLDVIRSLLKCTRVQIDTATSGSEAVGMVADRHYDVVFIDHRMPGMDGIETLHAIWQEGIPRADGSIPGADGVRFIALTANAAKDSRQHYIREGFNDYLAKPVDPQELEEMLIRQLPKRLVTLSAGRLADTPSGGSAEGDEFLRNYGKLEGADIEATMKYCRGAEPLQKAARSFCDGAEKNAGTLMRAVAGGDLKLCGLTAHTLKTGLRLLGFTALSLAAARLEEYADTGYEEGLRLLVPDFAAEVSGCGKRLAECLAKTAGGNPPGQAESLDPGKLREAALALEECAASGDLRTAGRILGMLAGHGLTEAMRELVTQAGQAARNGDKELFCKLVKDIENTNDTEELSV